MTTLADPQLLAEAWLEDEAWDLHEHLAELGVDTPDDPCPDCASPAPHPFQCGTCTGRTCQSHEDCR